MNTANKDCSAKEWFDSLVNKYQGDPEFEYEGIMLDISEQISKLFTEQGMNRDKMSKRIGTNKANNVLNGFLEGHGHIKLRYLSDFAVALNSRIKISFVPFKKASTK